MYTELQLSKLIEDVEREFTTHLAKAENAEAETVVESAEPTLVKAEDKPEKKEAKPDEKAPEAEKKPEGESKPAAEAKPEGEGPPAAPGKEAAIEGENPTAAPAALAPPSGEGGGEGGAGYDAEDLAHMQKMYASMSKAELKVHHDCIAELAKCGDMSQGQAPAAPEAPAQESAPMAKSEEIKPVEVKAEVVAPNKEVDLLKSELNESKTKLETLQKQFDGVAAFLTKLVEKKGPPAAKAITSLEAIEKSEGANDTKPLAKDEIHSILCKKSAEPSLKKSDRDAINVYYADGQVDIKGISHLLK